MSEFSNVFAERFGITRNDLERLLSAALSEGGDYADLYFEHRDKDSLTFEEGILKNASTNIGQGVGIRVVAGEQTGYAYAESFEMPDMLKAAGGARAIAHGSPGRPADPVLVSAAAHRDLYRVPRPLVSLELPAKLELLTRADLAARGFDRRVAEVRVVLANEVKHVLVYGSGGDMVSDIQPLTVFQVSCIAVQGRERQIGIKGGGGRVGIEFFSGKPPEFFAREAARQAVLLLEAREAPAGPMQVVLGPGWPGILLHEAIGHGLEADFNRKKLSAFSGRIGTRVAS